MSLHRCEWVGSDQLYIEYHDREWGVPSYNDRHLFEMLNLEGAQAGLSWITILRKRENYRNLFDDFDPEKVSRYSSRKINALLNDAGIVRNRLKIEAVILNARAYLELLENESSFSDFLWQFVDGRPVSNKWKTMKEAPASNEQSSEMSMALKKRGFKFVGSTICYAFMQAVGMVNDHTTRCFRYQEIRAGKQ